jgi:glucose-1-phosphate thymidylyltransferase
MMHKSTKGIILAGGAGTRLYPITKTICKQLLPVYNKPMIYYPLSQFMLAGIRDILLISTPEHLPKFEQLLGNGAKLGVSLKYAQQKQPKGIAEAFIIGKEFIGSESICLILGDNIFFGQGLPDILQKKMSSFEGAVIFAQRVENPQRYGVVELDREGNAVTVEEKPLKPKSKYAVTGLYLYDNSVINVAEGLKPSARGELEITDVNQYYLDRRRLKVQLLGRGYAWLDTGTSDSLLDASNYIATMERRQGLKIGCPEETALRMGYISKDEFRALVKEEGAGSYGRYLSKIEAEDGF